MKHILYYGYLGLLLFIVSCTDQNQEDCTGITLNIPVNGLTATASVQGGTAPYTYSWLNGGTGISHTYSVPGDYVLTVVDDNGCTMIKQFTIQLGGSTGSNTVTDIDGNVYRTVQIYNRVWMAENLRTHHYANGDPIPNVINDAPWIAQITGAWCNYNNNLNYDSLYGKLYNFYTCVDPRRLCPTGWHVPSESEWSYELIGLNSEEHAGLRLKDTTAWENEDNTNSTGFTALPCGSRSGLHPWDIENGNFTGMGYNASWWTCSPGSNGEGSCHELKEDSNGDYWDYDPAFCGHSVRCIKDE